MPTFKKAFGFIPGANNWHEFSGCKRGYMSLKITKLLTHLNGAKQYIESKSPL